MEILERLPALRDSPVISEDDSLILSQNIDSLEGLDREVAEFQLEKRRAWTQKEGKLMHGQAVEREQRAKRANEALVLDGDEGWDIYEPERLWKSEEERKGFVHSTFLGDYFKEPVPWNKFSVKRAELARETGIPDLATDDAAFDSFIKDQYQGLRDRREIFTGTKGNRESSMYGLARRSGLDGEDGSETFNQWMSGAENLPGFDPEMVPTYMQQWNAIHLREAQRAERVEPIAREIHSVLERYQGGWQEQAKRVSEGKEMAKEGDERRLLGLIRKLDTPEDRAYMREVIEGIVSESGDETEQKTMKALLRPVRRVINQASSQVKRFGSHLDATAPAWLIGRSEEDARNARARDATAQARLDDFHELADILEGVIDPLEKEGTWDMIWLGGLESVGHMATYFVPGGMAANWLSYTEDARQEYIGQGIAPDKAAKMAAFTGAAQMWMDKWQLKILRKSPNLRSLKLGQGLARTSGKAAYEYGKIVVAETAIEAMQDFISPTLVQKVGSWLDGEIPDRSLKEAIKASWEQSPEVMLAMLLPAGFGSAVTTANNYQAAESKLRLDRLLKGIGVKKEYREKVAATNDPEVTENWIRAGMHDLSDPDRTSMEALLNEIGDGPEMAAQRLEMAKVRTMVSKSDGWHVVSNDGTSVVVSDLDAANTIVENLWMGIEAQEATTMVGIQRFLMDRPMKGLEVDESMEISPGVPVVRENHEGNLEIAIIDPRTKKEIEVIEDEATMAEFIREVELEARLKYGEQAGPLSREFINGFAPEGAVSLKDDAKTVEALTYRSGNALTQIHEMVEGRFRSARVQNLISLKDSVEFIRGIEAAIGETLLEDETNETDVRELISKIVVAHVMAQGREQSSQADGKLAGLPIQDASRISLKRMSGGRGIAGMIHAAKEYFGRVFRLAAKLRKARREDRLTDDSATDQFINRLLGIDEDVAFQEEVVREAEEILGGARSFAVSRAQDAAYMQAVEDGDMAMAQAMVDEVARRAGFDTTTEFYHGTTHKFDVFTKERGNPENDMGIGFYLSSSRDDATANYAGEGPDLTGRIEQLAERIEQDEEIDPDEAFDRAKEELAGGEERLISAYLKLDNPARISDRHYVEGMPMFDEDVLEDLKEEAVERAKEEFDVEDEADLEDWEVREKQEEIAEENGYFNESLHPVQKAIYAVKRAGFDASETAEDSLIEKLSDGISMKDLADALKEVFMDADHPTLPASGTGEAVRMVFEAMEYDSIIDYTVNDKFGTGSGRVNLMEGLYEGVQHVIAFESNQIKSSDPVTEDSEGNVIPLSQRFDQGKDSISFSIGRATVTPDPETQQFEGAPGSPSVVGPASFAISAWHGTPHEVDEFSTDYIGTGEGAQVYGHGLYFAGLKEVGQGYQKSLGTPKVNGEDVFEYLGKTHRSVHALARARGITIDEAMPIWNREAPKLNAYGLIASYREQAKSFAGDKKVRNLIEQWEDSGVVNYTGNLYKVSLNVEQDELLDWDKRIDLKEWKGIIDELKTKSDLAFITDFTARYQGGTPQGQDAYKRVAYMLGSSKAASDFLSSKGIKGIKYLDGMSRDSGEGTSNYVIFDDADIEIESVNGEQDNRTSFAVSRNHLRIRRTRKELIAAAEASKDWKDFYSRFGETLERIFGEDAEVFTRLLAATSQSSTVKSNVALALKAFGQLKRGQSFEGFLGSVIGNLDKVAAEVDQGGQKISEFERATLGAEDAVVVDRHIARTLFGVTSPSAAQVKKAKKVITELAEEMGWTPREVQASLWAASIRKSKKEPASYEERLQELEAQGTLESRIGQTPAGSAGLEGEGSNRGFASEEGDGDGKRPKTVEEEVEEWRNTPDEEKVPGRPGPKTPSKTIEEDESEADIPWEDSKQTFGVGVAFDPKAMPIMTKKISAEIMRNTDTLGMIDIDRMRVGEFEGVPLQGGMNYATTVANLAKRIVWAFNEPGVATQVLNRAHENNGYIKLVLMAEGNVVGNKTFAKIWLNRMEKLIAKNPEMEAIFLKELETARLAAVKGEVAKIHRLNKKKHADKQAAENKKAKKEGRKPKTFKYVARKDETIAEYHRDGEGMTTFKEARTFLEDMGQIQRGAYYFRKGTLGEDQKTTGGKKGDTVYTKLLSKTLAEKNGWSDAKKLVADLEEPAFKGMKTGDVVALIRIDLDQEEGGMTAKEAGVPEHMSYGYVLKGEPVARMKKIHNIEKDFPQLRFSMQRATYKYPVSQTAVGAKTFSVGTPQYMEQVAQDLESIQLPPMERLEAYELARAKIEELIRAYDSRNPYTNLTNKAVDDERKLRRAARQSELEEAVWARFGAVLADDSLTKLVERPLWDLMMMPYEGKGLPRLRIMSKSKAVRTTNYNPVLNGDYDNAGGLPSWIFGGTMMPDQAAEEAYAENLIPVATSDALWDGLRSEMESVESMKQELKQAKYELKEAREKALAETYKWAKREREKIAGKKNFNRGQAILDSLRVLEAVVMTLPAEIRGLTGNASQLAELTTDAAREKFFKKRLKKVNSVFERWLQEHYQDIIAKAIKSGLATNEPGERPTGNVGLDASRFFHDVRQVVDLEVDEIDLMELQYEQKEASILARTTNNTEEELQKERDLAENRDQERIFDMFAGVFQRKPSGPNRTVWIKSASDMAAAAKLATEILETGRNQWRMIEEARLAAMRELREETIAALGGAKAFPEAKAAVEAMKKARRNIADIRLRGMSFVQYLEMLLGKDNSLVKRWNKMVQTGTAQKTQELMEVNQRLQSAVSEAMGTNDEFETVKRIFEMRHTENIPVTHYKGTGPSGALATQTLKVPLDIARKFLAGEVTGSSVGLFNADKSALEEGLRNATARTKSIHLTRPREAGEAVEIQITEATAMSLIMLSKQARYEDNLERWGWKKEEIDALEEKISDEGRRMIEWLLDEYAANYEPLARVYRRMYGVDLPQNTNYSPVRAFHDGLMREMDAYGQGLMPEGGMRGGMLKNRKDHSAELKPVDVFSVYYSHMAQTAHYKAFAESMRELNGIFLHQEVSKAIERNFGIAEREDIQEWVKTLEANGNPNARTNSLDRSLNIFQRGIATMALAGKVSTLLVQSTAAFAASARMPQKEFMIGFSKLMSGQLADEFAAIHQSKYIRRRVEAGASPLLRTVMDSNASVKPTRGTMLVGQLMELIGTVDGFFTAASGAIAFDYYLQKNLEAGMSPELARDSAREEAEETMRRTAQPVELADKSLLEVKTNAMTSFYMLFVSDARMKTAMITTAIDALRKSRSKKDAQAVVSALVYVMALSGGLAWMLRTLWWDLRDDDDDEFLDEKHWNAQALFMAMALSPLEGIPLVRDAVSKFSNKGPLSPITIGFSTMASLAEEIVSADFGTEPVASVERKLVKISQMIGAVYSPAVPAAVLMNVIDQVFDLADNVID